MEYNYEEHLKIYEGILLEIRKWFPQATLEGHSILDRKGRTIVSFETTGIDNDYQSPYSDLEFSKEDVFKHIGRDLRKLEVKEKIVDHEADKYKRELKEFMKYMGSTYPEYLVTSEEDTLGRMYLEVKNTERIVISWDGNIDYNDWHVGVLSGRHEVFNFSNDVYGYQILQQKDFKLFEELVTSYLRHIHSFEIPKVNATL